ncbi:hypothetical protein [Pseudooceanicola algae]|uniref:Uncharacterized protein n=1 Tax=Pseudooceanicola algae TaxID=1537215 RepID=A0A418SF99_9RHOB|nr:hypothetical protein [Pseudooceanicola algae]QPM89236.1 hypothetical protein PSAL_004510 [Pseudooceanicola algae]
MARQKCLPAAGLALALVLTPLFPRSGSSAPVEEIVRLFASCAGRLSAEMEHQWLFSDPASGATAIRRNQMIDLLDAVAPEGADSRVRALRLEAKVAQARLLRRAAFSWDAVEAARATRVSARFLARCNALLPQQREAGGAAASSGG